MEFREAIIADIPQIQFVRNMVKENQLSDPNLVPDKDVEDYIINRGKGWVCEIDNKIIGFAIVSVTDNNVWHYLYNPVLINRELDEDSMIICLIGILRRQIRTFG